LLLTKRSQREKRRDINRGAIATPRQLPAAIAQARCCDGWAIAAEPRKFAKRTQKAQ
jgi:hypothetical protein